MSKFIIYIWLQANKLSLNGQKTYYIIFHSRIKLTSYSSNLVMGDSIITATNEIKYLRVLIDNKITWIPHITYVKKKFHRVLA